jgi:hypothetical protein
MKKVFYIFVVVALAILSAVPVLADTMIVTVLGVPAFTTGITTFHVTYVSDTEMDLNWIYDATVNNVMVRAKYGSYPTNPPNSSTAPSDGYLVYYGSGTSAIDTSMDMNQNAGTLYYEAWGQKSDGSWYLIPSQSSKESREVILLALLGLGGGLSFFAIKGKNILLAVLASVSWLIVFAYNQSTPIAGFVKGSSGDIFVEVLLIGLMITIPLCAWSFRKNEKAKEEREDVDWNAKQSDRKASRPPSYGELTDTSSGVDLLHMSDAEYLRVLQNSNRKNKR